MRQHGLQIELRVARHETHVLQDRLALRVELDLLVLGAGLHAVRRGEHQVARDRDAGAEVAVRADQHDFGPRRGVGHHVGAADHRGGGR